MKNKNLAFTLAELAIVITVIGLVISAFLVISKFNDKARLDGVASQMLEVKQAYQSFQDIYNGRPGDLYNATDYFDSVTDGNGNGVIDWNAGNGGETPDAWEHLLASGLIKGTMNPDNDRELELRAIRGGIFFLNVASHSTFYGKINDTNAHIVKLGEYDNNNNALFIPRDAYYIDTKLDDGLPKTGLVSFRGNIGNVTSTTCTGSGSSRVYDLTRETLGCNMVFDIDHN